MTIGELLKEERTRLGKTQKEFSFHIISPSYYAKVEKNIHRITAEDLIKLLDYNNISVTDFFNRLTGNKGTANSRRQQIWSKALHAMYDEDQAALIKVKQEISRGNLADKDDMLLYINGWLEDLKSYNSSYRPNPKIVSAIKNKIFDMPNFNKEKLELYNNNLQFYTVADNKMIVKRIMKQYQGDQDKDIQIELLGIISNLLITMIEHKDYHEAQLFINYANRIKTRPELFFYKNVLLLLENMIAYHFNKKKEHLRKCKIALNNYALLGLPAFAKSEAVWFKRYKNQ